MDIYKNGEAGEMAYLRRYSFPLFGLDGLRQTDERDRHREGEFRLPNGELVEVKSDKSCFREERPTGNLAVEIEHNRDKDGYGWYQHCGGNGVAHLVYICYRDKECSRPCFALYIPFEDLADIVETLGDEYRTYTVRDGKHTSKILCIPWKDFYRLSERAKFFIPLETENGESPLKEFEEEILPVVCAMLGENVKLGRPSVDFIPDREDRYGGA